MSRIYVPVTNEFDCLAKMEDVYPDGTILVNNTNSRLPLKPANQGRLEVLNMMCQLHFSQIMNAIQNHAKMLGLPFYLWGHADAMCTRDTILTLIDEAARQTDPTWGVIFTHYDVLSAVNMNMVAAVGDWDWRFFPQYFADNDYYHRVRLAGFKTLDSSLKDKVIHDNGASTSRKRDPLKRLSDDLVWNQVETTYKRKWGGAPGHETLTKSGLA